MSPSITVDPEVRVMVVDDSAFMRTALTRMIQSEQGFSVVGTASSGPDALAKIPALNPDIVTLDVQMPGMDGLATLREIMSRFPRPVIMVSAATEKDADVTFNALSAGAFDYVPKQMMSTSLEIAHIRSDLIAKIRAAAQTRQPRPSHPPRRKPPQSGQPLPHVPRLFSPEIVAIACSTGGPKALEQILPCLPANFPLPILIVQHMPPGFTKAFAQRLCSRCAIDVHEAVQGEAVKTGTAYLCPCGLHMRVVRPALGSGTLISLDMEPADSLHIPSADVLMTSVAAAYKSHALGVILTGMGNDGAEGMKAIYREGGFTIGQDEATCAVYGMPRACAELGVLMRVVPLPEIAREIISTVRTRLRA